MGGGFALAEGASKSCLTHLVCGWLVWLDCYHPIIWSLVGNHRKICLTHIITVKKFNGYLMQVSPFKTSSGWISPFQPLCAAAFPHPPPPLPHHLCHLSDRLQFCYYKHAGLVMILLIWHSTAYCVYCSFKVSSTELCHNLSFIRHQLYWAWHRLWACTRLVSYPANLPNTFVQLQVHLLSSKSNKNFCAASTPSFIQHIHQQKF